MMDVTILVVDDVEPLRLLVRKILTSHGFLVEEAQDGEEAVRKIREDESIKLVLLDIVLPDMTGYDVMQQIRDVKEQRGIKVCFLSGMKTKEDILQAIKTGGDDYIVKPIYPEALVHKVNLLLDRRDAAEGFAVVSTRFRAELKDVPVQPDLVILQMSEAGILMRSTAAFQKDMQVSLASPGLSKHTQFPGTFTFRVVECQRISHGKYFLRMGFVGLPEENLRVIRSLAIRGGFLTSE